MLNPASICVRRRLLIAMASLSDQIDRLTRSTRAIKTTAAQIAPSHPQSLRSAAPFTHAVLNAQLGDLIRDVDPSELGLFTLVSSSTTAAPAAQPPAVQRVQFSGATPLRKAPRRDNTATHAVEPEVFAQAALKYIDRYHPIRQMPRAYAQVQDILERLHAVRTSLASLSETMKEARSSEVASNKELLKEEETRLQRLQSKMLELNKRKHAVTTLPPKRPEKPIEDNVRADSPLSSPREEKFWNAPMTSMRTLQFTDGLLMDEQVELGDISNTSLESPLSYPKSVDQVSLSEEDTELQDAQDESLNIHSHRTSEIHEETASSNEPKDNTRSENSSSPVPRQPDSSTDSSEYIEVPLGCALKLGADPAPPASMSNHSPRQSSKQNRVKITSEVERIISKIWRTVGDVIMPGHSFDTSIDAPTSKKPPLARETIEHLRQLSTSTPLPESPSAASASTASAGAAIQPTSQQVLMAFLLVSLLSTPPHYSIPLNKVKEMLIDRVRGSESSSVLLGQSTTRVLYGCVAKRLVKIDRGGGEQIVKFDV